MYASKYMTPVEESSFGSILNTRNAWTCVRRRRTASFQRDVQTWVFGHQFPNQRSNVSYMSYKRTLGRPVKDLSQELWHDLLSICDYFHIDFGGASPVPRIIS
jgi:hypothetical protein